VGTGVAVGGTGVGDAGREVAVSGAVVEVAFGRGDDVGELSGVDGTWEVLVGSTLGFVVKTEVKVRSGVK
jgi:hypothetical protein